MRAEPAPRTPFRDRICALRRGDVVTACGPPDDPPFRSFNSAAAGLDIRPSSRISARTAALATAADAAPYWDRGSWLL